MKTSNTKLVILYREFKNKAYKELSDEKRERFLDYLIENYENIANNPVLIEKRFNEIKGIK